MEDEQPSVAIIGAGPIGIEAALYARYLGFPVTVYDAGRICEHVRQWGHVQLFSPFRLNCSSLGLSALTAQNPNPDHPLPAEEDFHTGKQWVDSYLEPLANSDLVRRSLRLNTKVESIARDTSQVDQETARGEVPFRIKTRDAKGKQAIDSADIVIDATGTFGQANSFGIGGMPVVDEPQDLPNSRYSQRIPDLGEYRPADGDHFMVVGRGYSAATNILQIKQLQSQHPGIRCTWLTRGTSGSPAGPMSVMNDDPLPYRNELATTANELATKAEWLDWKPGLEIKAVERTDNGFQIKLSDDQDISVTHLLANTGFHGDYQMLQPLQVHRCYASGGPMAWAASVVGTSGDCLQQTSSGPAAIKTTEPNFFIIGSKSYGTDPRFLFSTGLQQIRDVFKLVAERETLDLYSTLKPNTVGG